MNATASSFVSSDLTLMGLVVGHNILPKGGHRDALLHYSAVSLEEYQL